MTLKILVTGPFSTGKTTLVDALEPALRFRGLSVIRLEDAARSCPFPLNKAQTDEASTWLATTQVSRELSATAMAPNIILCDRGVPDILAHQEELRESGKGALFESMRPFLEQWSKTYDTVLATLVDSNISPIADGLRLADAEYRAKLLEHSKAVLARFVEPVWLSNDPEERIVQALDAIWL